MVNLHVTSVDMLFFCLILDKNECDGEDICQDGQYCVNNPGSYSCQGEWYIIFRIRCF